MTTPPRAFVYLPKEGQPLSSWYWPSDLRGLTYFCRCNLPLRSLSVYFLTLLLVMWVRIDPSHPYWVRSWDQACGFRGKKFPGGSYVYQRCRNSVVNPGWCWSTSLGVFSCGWVLESPGDFKELLLGSTSRDSDLIGNWVLIVLKVPQVTPVFSQSCGPLATYLA